jgi:hypothetical protein
MGWAYLTQEEAQRTIEPNTLTLMYFVLCFHLKHMQIFFPLQK